MEKEIDIHLRLSEIQRNLKVPKNQYNSHGKYKFRSCEDILDALKKILLDDETIHITDDVVNVGNRNYLKSTASFVKGNKSVKANGFACEAEQQKGMQAAQLTGSSSSYARKYALNGLFAIDDTKDSDSLNEHGNASTQEAKRDYGPSACKYCKQKTIYKTGETGKKPQFKCECGAAGWLTDDGKKINWRDNKK